MVAPIFPQGLARTPDELARAVEAVIEAGQDDRARGLVVADGEDARRTWLLATYRWLAGRSISGPITDGPADTVERVREELANARYIVSRMTDVVHQLTIRGWRAQGVVDLLAFALGETRSVPTCATPASPARRAA